LSTRWGQSIQPPPRLYGFFSQQRALNPNETKM
jgi:hypothetical protein